MDINTIVKNAIPSKKQSSQSSEIQFESISAKMRDIVFEQDPASGPTPAGGADPGESPGSKWKNKKVLAGGAGALGLGALATGAAIKRNQIGEKAAAQSIKAAQTINPDLKQIKIGGSTPDSSQVADISKATIAGKTGDAAENMGKAAGQWGQTLKAGAGGVADFASRNPHLALAATALGGVAALRKLRRR